MGLLLPIILITLIHNGKNCDTNVAQLINEVKQLILLLVSYTQKIVGRVKKCISQSIYFVTYF